MKRATNSSSSSKRHPRVLIAMAWREVAALGESPVQTEHACSCLHNSCANIVVDILFAQ